MTKMQSRSFDSLSKDFWITDDISLHTDLLRHSSILLFVKIWNTSEWHSSLFISRLSEFQAGQIIDDVQSHQMQVLGNS